MAAPFSEPREWVECLDCEARASNWRRYFRGDAPEDAFGPCLTCQQPPRCTYRQHREDHCERPATTTYSGPLPDFCGQHSRNMDISHEIEEWEIARDNMRHFRGLAKGLGNWALVEAMDLAYAECEMRLHSLETEQRMIWDGE